MGLPANGKVIKDYPKYIAFPDGRIFSLFSNKFLKWDVTKRGYASVELFNESGSKRLNVHRIIAKAFIPNPNNYPQINHIDENPSNNAVENLEWCTAKYNMNYGNGAKTRHSKTNYKNPIFTITAKHACEFCKRPVLQYSKSGKFIARYESAQDAGRKAHCHGGHISECCAGKRYKTVGGYVWRFEKEE